MFGAQSYHFLNHLVKGFLEVLSKKNFLLLFLREKNSFEFMIQNTNLLKFMNSIILLLYSSYFLGVGILAFFKLNPKLNLSVAVFYLILFILPFLVSFLFTLFQNLHPGLEMVKLGIYSIIILGLIVLKFTDSAREVSQPSFQKGGAIVPLFFGIIFGSIAIVFESILMLIHYFLTKSD